MGEALVVAMLRSGVAADAVIVAEKAGARAQALAATHGVRTTAAAAEAVAGADVVVVAVKPQDVAGVLAEIGPALADGALVVTVAAGLLNVPESQLDAVTAISGSGPAYVFYLVDALAEAGVLLGLPRAQALELAVATFRGAAALLTETGEHPVVLRERVSSPGGTTVAALQVLDAHGVRAAMMAAATAARDRSRELAAEADGRELER